ncbi:MULTISPECIES: helicase-exonuclease AddAB subunit AddA [unclassified Paenibacillus]|uniref:helicase-exonuclease AddAB subunit AddA n=1 Tax=unclassified Paenibacillus TaxID=185978 RepID=UPI0009A6BC51|nr:MULTISPECIES: helicase-exonuclease AddAB subunit AddA [unclassified Paenibacillus]SLK11426.1 DNA helicase/exodeoxyribonuclease V, subunit A [Paenibacillus sp. RU5A]SOC72235.1 DNA helicase/exodeoxyribonuclease V, subunit A [Paenibacillus sp. RU26A]SOC74620.1 DNA helicase/exodeoxyribonuclease V, subunit A [Paenibacillus sp. RU5M]
MTNMPKPEGSFWSDDQWSAISQSGEDILVAAAAGSGKTAVLVERIIRKIADPSRGFSVDRLLVATFTKAAAAEMKQRIREALERALEEQPAEEHLRKQLSLLGRASITTLHSFCMEVIRRYYQQIPLNPAFRILNENEAEIMRQELLEQLFEEKYGEEDEGSTFRELVDWFSGERNDDAMHRLVQRLYDFSRSHSWPDHWLAEMASAFQVESVEALGHSAWVQSILRDAALALSGAAGLLRQGISISMQPEGPKPYADTLKEDLAMVEELLSAVEVMPWERLPEVFQPAAFGKLKPCKKDQTDPGLQEQVKELREAAKKAVTDLKGSLFGRSAFSFWQELEQAAPLMQELSKLVSAFGERYRQAKQERGQVDFSDLEHYCLHILRHEDSTPELSMPSDAAMEYRARFDEVLLDEYQDTNTVQEDIVRLISRENPGNRFMVGDVKQSIYRFRLAEPGLFLNKYRQYAANSDMDMKMDGERESLHAGRRIDLARNFRSRAEVVHSVNVLFKQLMNEGVAEIAYDERAQLAYGATFPAETLGDEAYTPELILIDRQGGGPDLTESTDENGDALPSAELESAELETAQLEARAMARRIREMVGDTDKPALNVYDKALKSMRPARYGDIVILLRSALMWAPLMIEEFRQQGIPAGGEQSKGYFQATEVEVMLSLLQIVDNPRQDIPLASVLRSPIVGLDEEELAQIRLGDKRQSFYDAVISATGAFSSSLNVFGQHGEKASNPDSSAIQLQWPEVWSEMEQGQRESAVSAEAELIERIHETSVHADKDEIMDAGIDASMGGRISDDADRDNGTSTELQQKLIRFMRQLEHWRLEARQGSLSELIWCMYRETGYLDWVGGLPGGMQRQSNLKALYDRARQYEEATANRGLFRFLTYVSRLRENGGDLGTVASGSGEQDNAVRIMTIHRSKGLEFPIVFVGGISKMFNQQDLNSPFLMHKELGFGPRFVDRENRVAYPTLANLAIRRRAQFELLAEEMRVLYVALTRPKEKMILVGTVKDVVKKAVAWSQIKDSPERVLPDYLLAAGRSYLDWIGPSLMRHPDAALLRELAGGTDSYAACLVDDESRWGISVISADQVSREIFVDQTLGEEDGMTEVRKHRIAALKAVQPVELFPSSTEEEMVEDTQDATLRDISEEDVFTIGEQEGVQLLREVDKRLSWAYPHQAATQVAASTSVTELKTLLAMQDHQSLQMMEEVEEQSEASVDYEGREVKDGGSSFKLHLRRPKFMEEKQLTGAERGTVYHTLMQHLPVDGSPVDSQIVEQTLLRLVELQILLPHQAEVIESDQLAGFFNTEPGTELLRAEWMKREIPFIYGLPAHHSPAEWLHSLSPDSGIQTLEEDGKMQASLENETVLVQGIIDCLYEVDGELVLLDYKTDRVLEHRGGLDKLTENYRFQLELYGRAIEDILGRKVDRKWLYFFDGGHAVKL